MPEVYRYVAPAEINGHADDVTNTYASAEGTISEGGGTPGTIRDHQARGSSAPIDKTDWRSTARTTWGAPVAIADINDRTIIEINGRRDTLAYFKNAGQIPFDHTQAPTVALQAPPVKQEEAPKEDRPPVPKDAVELWERTEATVIPLLEQGGTAGYAVAEAMIGGSDPAQSIDSLAQITGVPPEQLTGTVTQAFNQYIDVTRRAVGMDETQWSAFTAYCDAHHPKDRAEAARKVFHSGDLSGVRDLVAKFKDAGGGFRAGASDDSVYRALSAQGVDVFRSPNGTTMIRFTSHGAMSWREAEKRGLLEFGD